MNESGLDGKRLLSKARRSIWLVVLFILLTAAGIWAVGMLEPTYRTKVRFEFLPEERADPYRFYDNGAVSEEFVKILFLKHVTPEQIRDYLDSVDWQAAVGIDIGDKVALAIEIQKKLTLEMKQAAIAREAWGRPVMRTTGFDIIIDSPFAQVSAFIGTKLSEYMLSANHYGRIEDYETVIASLLQREGVLNNMIGGIEAELFSIESENFQVLSVHARENRRELARLGRWLDNNRLSLDIYQRALADLEATAARLPRLGQRSEQVAFLERRLNASRLQFASLSEVLETGHPDLEMLAVNIRDLEEYLDSAQSGVDVSEAGSKAYLMRLNRKRDTYISRINELKLINEGLITESAELEQYLRSTTDGIQERYSELSLEKRAAEQEVVRIRRNRYGLQQELMLEEAGKVGRFELLAKVGLPESPLYPNRFAWGLLVIYMAAVLTYIIARHVRINRPERIHTLDDLKSVSGEEHVFLIPVIS